MKSKTQHLFRTVDTEFCPNVYNKFIRFLLYAAAWIVGSIFILGPALALTGMFT